MSSQVNSDIPPSSAPVVMLSAPDTQDDNPQDVFHTPREQASLHSSDVNVVPPSAGSQVLDDPSDDSVFLDEIKNFHDDFQLGFGEDFPPVNDDDPSDNVVPHSAGSQVLDDPSDHSVFLDEIKNFHDDFQLGFGEDFLPVNDDNSCKDIPMDKNSVPEKNAVNDVDLFRETERSSSYEIGEGSRNVNLVEGHNHNKSSGEGGEVSESLNVFDVLRYLANTANKVEDDGLTLLESLKRAGIKFPRPSWWSDDMKSELFNFDDEEQRK